MPYIILAAFIISGWIINIVTLASADSFTGFQIAQALGVVVFPVGVILGWVSLFI